MPSNYILINEKIEYFVHDKKMPELMQWLKDNARKEVTGLLGKTPNTPNPEISYSHLR